MSKTQEAMAKVRRALGDSGQPFTDTFVGFGTDNGQWDLSGTNINGATLLYLSGGVTVALVENTDYRLDKVEGTLYLTNINPLPVGSTLILSGTTYGLFTDAEIEEFVKDAFVQHSSGRSYRERVRDQRGFISYIERALIIDDLGDEEIFLVGMLATIEALWVLTTDAALDVDIHTPDGTSISRSQRYAQMRNQIAVLTDKYDDLCAQLNVGLHRVETMTVRRTSRATGRLVPIFESREYDDYAPPRRILPPVDNRNADESDIPSSLNTAYGW